MQSAFAAAKAGVINFTRSHALEVGKYGIRVNAIAPGSVLVEGTKSMFYSPENKARGESLLSHVALGRPERRKTSPRVRFFWSPMMRATSPPPSWSSMAAGRLDSRATGRV